VVLHPRPIRWRTICYLFFFTLFISELSVALAPTQAQPKVLPVPNPKHVLVLYAYGDGLPAYQKATPAFISVMTAGGIRTDDLFFEYLDLQRNNNEEYRQRLAGLLRYKYAKRKPDLIVVVHTEALNFLLNEGKGLFPDVPVFSYLIVRPELIEAKNMGRRILQRPQNLDMEGTLEIALKMFPKTRKVVFVTGTAEGRLEYEARRAFEPWRDKLEFQFTSDRSVEEILQLVASLPPQTIVIYCNVFSDKTGRTFIPREVGKTVAKAANAPVFCLWDTLIGGGVIGGSLLSFEAEGTSAANMVLNILNGKISLTKPVTTLPTSKTFMFDSQQLKRWGVSESIVPKGSVLVNQVPTLWEQHRGLVIGGIAVFLAQTLLVFGLLIQRNLKRKAESSLWQKTEELDHFFSVNLDLLCIANIDGFFLRLNPIWEKVLGYTPEELTAKPFLEFVHPDDLDSTREAISVQASQQSVSLFENRYRCKDGTYRWLQWSSAPTGRLIYAAARDVTKRKQAEAALDERLRFEKLISEVSARLVNASPDRMDGEINQALGKIVHFFGVNACLLVEASPDRTKAVISHGALAHDESPVWLGANMLSLFPWSSTLVPRGEIISFSSLDELPEAAAVDKESYKAWGVRSALTIPVVFEGSISHSISLSSHTEDRTWPEEYIPRLRLLGEIILNCMKLVRANQTLRERELRLGLAATSAEMGMWTADLQTGTTWGTGKQRELFGFRADEEVRLEGILSRIHPEDREKFQQGMGRAMHSQGYHQDEFRVLLPDGRIRWISSRGRLQFGVSEKPERLMGVCLDITERKRAQEELKKSEERFRMLIETMNEGLGVKNEDGVWTYVNDQLCWMLGQLPGDIIGHPIIEFLDEVNQKIFEEEIEKQKKGNYSPYEIMWIRSDGRKVATIVSAKPILDSEGQLKEVFAVFTDITDRKRAEEALKNSEERFRQVAENVGDFIWEVDANGLYRYTSPSVQKILGYRPDELVGKRHFYDLFTPEIREELKAAVFEVFASKDLFRALPNPNVSKDGRVVHLETSGAPVLDAAGNLAGYRGADTDVTERKRTEEELRRHQEHLEELVRERTAELITARDEADAANRAKSQFLSNMSHELRTPLNSILGITQLMERDAGFPEQQRDTLKILRSSGTHLLELINDVLELSKIEAGKMTPDITSFDLHSFLGDLEEVTRLRAEQKGLELIFEITSDLPRYIETDVRKLRQILINLLSNAIKYTEKGRVALRIRLKERKERVEKTLQAKASALGRLEFEIEDTGVGIASEDMQRIFEPFVQLNIERGAREGTGLGLTLSRMFVELLGGEITIRSEVGRGSTFAFDIVVKLAEGAAVHTQEMDRRVIGLMPGQPPYRLLVVDDSVENRFVLRRLLEKVGFGVVEAASGQEALDLYKSSRPHLIWMDLRMPAMGGNEAARRIREMESRRRDEEGKEIYTPIIALTAGVMMNGERPSSHHQIFDGLVYKPFREIEIFDKLEKHLGVQFVYQSSIESQMGGDKMEGKAILTPADLSILSGDWLNEFSRALRKGYSAELLKLIDQIPLEHTDLAGTLMGLVRIHQFDKLIAVTEGTLRENSHG
jgi:PAS domain S-box-containing protein